MDVLEAEIIHLRAALADERKHADEAAELIEDDVKDGEQVPGTYLYVGFRKNWLKQHAARRKEQANA